MKNKIKRLCIAYLIITFLPLFTVGCESKSNPESTAMLITQTPIKDVVHQDGTENEAPWYGEVKIENTNSFGWSSPIFQHGHAIFYITETGIKKYSLDSEEKEIIVESNDIISLYVDRDFLYYLLGEATSNGFSIRRTSHNGADEETLFDHFLIFDFIVFENHVFFKADTLAVYLYDIETDELREILDEASSAVIIGDYIYYIENAQRSFSIFKKSIKTNERFLLRGSGLPWDNENHHNEIMVDNIINFNDALYYATRFPAALLKLVENNDYHIDIYPERDKIIVDFSNQKDKNGYISVFMFANETNLYFAYNMGNIGYLYRYDPKTNETEMLTEIEGFRPDLTFGVYANVLFYREYGSDIQYKLIDTT